LNKSTEDAQDLADYKDERINYRAKKDLVIIDELIEKITITKKHKMPVVTVIENGESNIAAVTETARAE
jgi:hypothetical protein